MTRSRAVGFQTMTGGSTWSKRRHRVKTKSPSVSLLDDVRESLAASSHGPARWHERLAPEHQAELAALRAAWLAGELGDKKKTVARSISRRLKDRGICIIGCHGVIAWLTGN
jgi:hypothetical protein